MKMSKKGVIGLIIAIIIIVAVVSGFAIFRNQVTKEKAEENRQANTSQNNQAIEIENTGNDNSINANEENENSASNKKILIAYFSWAKHTEKMANVIEKQTGGKLVQIERKEAYPTDYDECTDVALEEKNNNERPEINDLGVDLTDYDIIFIGYPNWWGDMPMPIYTFLEKNNFSGKTVIPFMTSYSSGTSGTFDKIENIVDGTVLDGIHISQSKIDNNNYESEMISWLNGLNY